jgi:hypothetical protein
VYVIMYTVTLRKMHIECKSCVEIACFYAKF